MMKRALAIACICAFSLAPSSPALAEAQISGPLPHGGVYVIQRDIATPVTAISLWFRVPASGYDGTLPGISHLAASAAASLPLVSGTSLAEFVRNMGGRFSINVFADLVAVDALVPNSQAQRVVAAMSAAYFQPKLNEKSLQIARRDESVALVLQQFSVDTTLQNALAMELYQSGPHHEALYPQSIASIATIPLTAVQAYARQAFRSNNAVLAIVGNVPRTIINVVSDPQETGPTVSPPASVPVGEAMNLTIKSLVAGIGIAWSGPSILDQRAATAMDFLANQVFAANDPNIHGQFVTLQSAGMFFASISGPNAPALKEALMVRIAQCKKPLDAATFARLHTAFMFRLRSQLQSPDAVADELGWYASEGNPAYAPGATQGQYWLAATSLTPEYVASIAAKYFVHPVVVHAVKTLAK